MQLSAEVSEAVAAGKPVVALESSLISHGLPWPHNLEVARSSEEAVRAKGAVPATTAVIDGSIRVGLADSELDLLAQTEGVRKVSVRDLAPAVTGGMHGATTVAATAHIACRAGISMMATGGLGGVHRNAAESFDVSADLGMLARADGLTVVCSGVKAILDIAKSAELLETLGIAVIGWRTDMLPGFWSAATGLRLSWRIDSADQYAALCRARPIAGAAGAVVIANPVPPDKAIGESELAGWIEAAHLAAASKGISGSELTPFLLSEIASASGGRTLEANCSLIVANALLAGELAAAAPPLS